VDLGAIGSWRGTEDLSTSPTIDPKLVPSPF
jgi:hypothetical protein